MSYLVRSQLPVWFLRPEHRSCLDDATESRRLNMSNVPQVFGRPPPPEYLPTRYRSAVQYPRPDQNETYGTELVNDEQISALARRFPAVLANARRGRYRIFVDPTGHVIVAGGTNITERIVPVDQVEWQHETPTNLRASYALENTGAAEARAPVVAMADRQTEIDRIVARNDSAVIDPARPANGHGAYRWLNNAIDAHHAATLGYNTPFAFVEARGGGAFADMFDRELPRVVFYPDLRYLNPTEQPEGNGEWEFLTDEAGDHARLDWADSELVNNNQDPTAADIWALRQYFATRVAGGEADEDLTRGIDIVWVPSDPPPGNAMSEEEEEEIDDMIDPDSGLRHEPKNRGENDQTGQIGQARYQTLQIKGRSYTIDRAPAHVGVVEPHKSWYVTKKGTWKQWDRYSSLDWNDKKLVDSMNKTRNQALGRAQFPLLRPEKRESYTDEERGWLFEYVKKAKAGTALPNWATLTRLFNKRFNSQRNENGIMTIYNRLCEEYDQNDGEMKPRYGRGQNKIDEAAQRREDAEPDEE